MKISEYVFNVGDEVITIEGVRGEITDICKCVRCVDRGFFEPIWEDENCIEDYITRYEAEHNFSGYHKICNYYFNHLNRQHIEQDIAYHEDMITRAKNRLVYVDALIATEGEITYETVESN